MWKALKESCSAGSRLGRFRATADHLECQPLPGEKLDTFFNRLMTLRNGLHGTKQNIPKQFFLGMIFSITINVPHFTALIQAQAARTDDPDIEQILHIFREAERTLALKKTPPAVASANVAAKAAKNGYCTLCETSTRDTARCRYKNKKRPNETSEESPQAQKSSKVECSYCLRNNHTTEECRLRKTAESANFPPPRTRSMGKTPIDAARRQR